MASLLKAPEKVFRIRSPGKRRYRIVLARGSCLARPARISLLPPSVADEDSRCYFSSLLSLLLSPFPFSEIPLPPPPPVRTVKSDFSLAKARKRVPSYRRKKKKIVSDRQSSNRRLGDLLRRDLRSIETIRREYDASYDVARSARLKSYVRDTHKNKPAVPF